MHYFVTNESSAPKSMGEEHSVQNVVTKKSSAEMNMEEVDQGIVWFPWRPGPLAGRRPGPPFRRENVPFDSVHTSCHPISVSV